MPRFLLSLPEIFTYPSPSISLSPLSLSLPLPFLSPLSLSPLRLCSLRVPVWRISWANELAQSHTSGGNNAELKNRNTLHQNEYCLAFTIWWILWEFFLLFRGDSKSTVFHFVRCLGVNYLSSSSLSLHLFSHTISRSYYLSLHLDFISLIATLKWYTPTHTTPICYIGRIRQSAIVTWCECWHYQSLECGSTGQRKKCLRSTGRYGCSGMREEGCWFSCLNIYYVIHSIIAGLVERAENTKV